MRNSVTGSEDAGDREARNAAALTDRARKQDPGLLAVGTDNHQNAPKADPSPEPAKRNAHQPHLDPDLRA